MQVNVYGKTINLIKRNGKFVKPPELKAIEGTGSALKPSHETWWLCRKPLAEPSIAANVLKYSTGALNIDASRVGAHSYTQEQWSKKGEARTTGNAYGVHTGSDTPVPSKRFPANTLLSHSWQCVPLGVKRVRSQSGANVRHSHIGKQGYGGNTREFEGTGYKDEDGMEQVEAFECAEDCPIRALDEMSGVSKSNVRPPTGKDDRGIPGFVMRRKDTLERGHNDQGGASRYYQCFPPDDMPPFIYTSKASRAERSKGCEALPERSNQDYEGRTGQLNSQFRLDGSEKKPVTHTNSHPTVKPVKLLNYLITMITPPNGIVLDMFAGSGSTGVACVQNGFRYILVEQEQEYIDIIHARLAHAHQAMPVQEQEEGEYLCSEDCPVRVLGEQSGERPSRPGKTKKRGESDLFRQWGNTEDGVKYIGDTGAAARFFQTFPPDSLFAGMDEEAL